MSVSFVGQLGLLLAGCSVCYIICVVSCDLCAMCSERSIYSDRYQKTQNISHVVSSEDGECAKLIDF